MIVGYNYLTQQQENYWTFYANSTWQTWERPSDCNMIHILVIGPGGGGGNGFIKTAGASGGGGGGGGTSGYVTLMIPSYLLPERLYINISSATIGPGTLPASNSLFVTTTLNGGTTNTLSSLIYFGTVGGTVAGAGSASGGVGGTAITGLTVGPVGALGVSKIIPGVAGQAGGLVANYDQTGIIGGGAGGALSSTANVAGNSITSAYKQQASVVVVRGTAAGATTKSGNGFSLFNPFQAFGGAGGANNNTTTGSAGGNGGIGCGGGGGGAGLTTLQSGGNGGNGMVIITCW